jgi:predicted ATPase/class 3 adenylate cyclase
MTHDFQGGGGSSVSARLDLPSGLVTFLFTDIEGSTRLAQLLGSDYRPVLAEHRRLLRHAVTSGGGVDLFTEGDSLFVAFTDAQSALRACAEAQRSLAGHDWTSAPPKVRMGLHSGYAEPHGGEYASPEVHRAARVAAAAHGGQVLCSAATARLAGALPDGLTLKDLGLYQLRGFDGRERLFQLGGHGLEPGFPRPRTTAATPHNLPAPSSSFIGRGREQTDLADLLTRHRLVSVVGTGGAGKTRLALQVASDAVPSFVDGVWFVDLAAVSDPYLVAPAVAEAIGVRPEPGRLVLETLADYVATRNLLLVIDTCDAHPAAIAPVIGRLLASSPGMRVLATSREPVGAPAELVWRIPPLSSKNPDGGTPDALALLLERAAAARGGRTAIPSELEHLRRVAHRLAGLPLALELAAARLRLLSPAELADRLDDLMTTLDAGVGTVPLAENPVSGRAIARRHATLRATVDWSYRTLPPTAATLLRHLSVFAGPLDLTTVEWIGGRQSLHLLGVLVDKSLIVAEPVAGGALSYHMLDPIRSFAQRELIQAGEEAHARDRHLAWTLYALARARTGVDGQPVALTTYPLDGVAVEARAGLHWAVESGHGRDGLRLAVGLDEWWRERGLAREARVWLFRLFERIADTGEEIPDAELAAALHGYSRHAGIDGEPGEQLRLLVQAEEAAWRTGQPRLIARISSGRGEALVGLGREEEAERACRDVIDWARARNVEVEVLPATFSLATLLWRRGALGEAATELGQARAVASNDMAERARRTVDLMLGLVALSRGDLVAAHDHLVVALRSRMTHGFHGGACEALTAMAVRCAMGGDFTVAARLFGAAQAARARLRAGPGVLGKFGLRHEVAVRASVGDALFDAAYGEGAAMSLTEATAAALAVEHPDMLQTLARMATEGDAEATMDLSVGGF